MADSAEKPMSLRRALREARKAGHKDPIVRCEDHGIAIPYSKLSPLARMALEAGLDVTEGKCLLLRGDE